MLNTMIETKHIIAELSVQEKICLYNALYEDLASKGIDGDTELAHVNKAEMDVLRAMGGSGTINPNTGLIQFGGGSPPPPPPSNVTQSQTTEFPSELKPYITDVLSKAQAIQEKRETEGYIPYEGPQVASFTPEQEQAFTGISGLVGQGEQYFDPATRLAASSAIAPRAGEVQQYMSPYMQNVVDIQQREARRQADVAAQQLGVQAVGAGAYGGSRQAILEAEQQRNLQTQLGDIQGRGLAAAYEDAQARMAAQRGRELAASSQFAQLGQIAPQQALKELTALEAVGAQQQAQSQRGLDIARSQFQAEQTFPEQTLQQYQSVIRGFPLAPSTYTNTQTTTPAPSYLQQAAGLGGLGLGVASAFGGFRKAQGGLVSRMSGGQIDQNSGLGSIVVRRQAGQLVNLSVEELEALANNLRVPGSQRAEASKLLQERKSNPASKVPQATPPVKSKQPSVPPTPPLSSPPSEPVFGTLASLKQTPKSDEYFAKATEILGKREKRILAKMDDPSDKYEYLASLLSGIAGGTPGAGLGQLASEVAPQALAGAKELRKDREELEVRAEDTSLQVGKLGAEQEEKSKKLEEAVFTALTKSNLTAKDLAAIAKDKVTAIEIIQKINDNDQLRSLANNLKIDPDVREAARLRTLNPKGKTRIGPEKPQDKDTLGQKVVKITGTN
jgi:hypothetical protein